MDLNKRVSKAGSSIVTVTVFLFAVFLMINFMPMTGMFAKMSSGGDGSGGYTEEWVDRSKTEKR